MGRRPGRVQGQGRRIQGPDILFVSTLGTRAPPAQVPLLVLRDCRIFPEFLGFAPPASLTELRIIIIARRAIQPWKPGVREPYPGRLSSRDRAARATGARGGARKTARTAARNPEPAVTVVLLTADLYCT
eukprot:1129606-Rhodomonas_salina.4